MNDIKNCPFCNGEPELKRKGNEYTKSRCVEIKCKNCRITRTDCVIRKNMEWVEKVAIEYWNARADDAVREKLLAYVKEVAQIENGHYSRYTDEEMKIESNKGYLHAKNIIDARELLKEIGK